MLSGIHPDAEWLAMAEAAEKSPNRRVVILLIAGVVLTGAAFLYSRSHVFYRVTQENMAGTLEPGDRLVIRRFTGQALTRGMLVLVEPDDGTGNLYVRRLVAMPGDRISTPGGSFHVNGSASPPPDPGRAYGKWDHLDQVLQPGEHYVLSDARETFEDSRDFGFIRPDQVRGIVRYRIGPLSRLGSL